MYGGLKRRAAITTISPDGASIEELKKAAVAQIPDCSADNTSCSDFGMVTLMTSEKNNSFPFSHFL